VEPPPSLRLPSGQAGFGRAGKFKAIQMLRLNGRAHAQQPVVKGCFIHCGVQSFLIKESSLEVSLVLIVFSALYQNTASAVFRPLNQQDRLGAKGEIRRSNFPLNRRSAKNNKHIF
jgi:hypothetical protein